MWQLLALAPCALMPSPVRLSPAALATVARRAVVLANAPTLREQMAAYIKAQQERGVELTPEQKAVMAEFESDDELMEQTGCVDFMKGAEVLSQEEFEASQQSEPIAAEPAAAVAAPQPVVQPAATVAPPPPPQPAAQPPAPVAAAPAVAAPTMAAPAATISPATARLWMVQQPELDAACAMLSRQAAGTALSGGEARELRTLLTSLMSTVAQAQMQA
jgi:hypothetical protein